MLRLGAKQSSLMTEEESAARKGLKMSDVSHAETPSLRHSDTPTPASALGRAAGRALRLILACLLDAVRQVDGGPDFIGSVAGGADKYPFHLAIFPDDDGLRDRVDIILLRHFAILVEQDGHGETPGLQEGTNPLL